MPHDHGHVLARLPSGDSRARREGDRGGRRGAPRVGELALGGSRGGLPQGRRAARRRPGAPRSTRRRCWGSRRRRTSRRSTRRASSSTSGGSTSPTRRRSTTSSRSATAACGTSSITGRSKASSTRCRPFNFTAIGGNLPTAPALMGNTVLWKPASQRACSRRGLLMRLLEEAGLPPGVINFVPGDSGDDLRRRARASRSRRRALHRQHRRLQRACGRPSARTSATYRSYPRIVGETGGKDFIVAHPSADPEALAVAIVRGGFEYQGQKCSAASRVYVPRSMWREVRDRDRSP